MNNDNKQEKKLMKCDNAQYNGFYALRTNHQPRVLNTARWDEWIWVDPCMILVDDVIWCTERAAHDSPAAAHDALHLIRITDQ